MKQLLLGLALSALAVGVTVQMAAANWELRQGPTDFIETDHAFGASASGQTLNVFCSDGVETIMAWGYPAQPGRERTEAFIVNVSGQEFVVQSTRVPPDGFWRGAAPAGLIEALRHGNWAEVAVPGAVSIMIDLAASSRAIDAALANCRADSVSRPPTGQFDASAPSRAAVESAIELACQGPYTLDEGALLSGLIDTDDVADFVLDWAGVICQSNAMGRGAGNCGINMCQISVALSAQDSTVVLGVAPELVIDAFGRARLRTVALRPSCPDGALDCTVLWQLTSDGLEARHVAN
ncbi:MAG: hypothetical protein V2I76_15205 [Roseobacter sp.]|jgi:hypothetical protein|nr:hypothetical protein [Roseobacter sp.]